MLNKKNSGFLALNKAPFQKEKTVIVSGIPRSGTSMIAKMLDEIGVFLGDSAKKPIYEDVELAKLLASKKFDQDKFYNLVSKRNNKHDIWGWKTPGSYIRNDLFIKKIRNPHYIIPFRDPLAIAIRNSLAVNTDIKKNLIHTYETQYKSLIAFVNKVEVPVLLFSYEKALLNKEEFLSYLLSYLDIEISQKQFDNVINSITPNNPGYIKLTSKEYDGHLDSCTNGVLKGWVKKVSSEDPININIYNHKNIIEKSVSANFFRKDLSNAGIGNGSYGFEVDITKHINKMSKDDVIRVVVDGTNYSLINSPITIAKKGN